MKKSLLFALCISLMPAFFTSCSDDDDDDDVVVPEYTDVVTFEDVTLEANSVADSAYTYAGVLKFNNNHANWGSYFALSNQTDTVTPGYKNEGSIFGTSGNNGSTNFAYCYYSEYMKEAVTLEVIDGNDKAVGSIKPYRVYMALTTYAALALRDGNDGGVYGDAIKLKSGSYFSVTLTGYKGDVKTGTVTAYPGDYRGTALSLMTSWTAVDLTALGEVTKIELTIGGSEDLYGSYGFNAPAYIALDDFSFTSVGLEF